MDVVPIGLSFAAYSACYVWFLPLLPGWLLLPKLHLVRLPVRGLHRRNLQPPYLHRLLWISTRCPHAQKTLLNRRLEPLCRGV